MAKVTAHMMLDNHLTPPRRPQLRSCVLVKGYTKKKKKPLQITLISILHSPSLTPK